MSELKKTFNNGSLIAVKKSEKGAALVIVILIMLLLLGFVAVVLSRVNTETTMTALDSAENRTLAASQAQIESDSRDFVNLFKRKLSPPSSDIDIIRASKIKDFDSYDLSKKTIIQTKNSEATEITGGEYKGLYSLQDRWEITVPALDKSTEVQTTLRRSFINDRIPLFQFGMFYEDDLELNRPPLFTFGGRVHTNGNLFISASTVDSGGGIYFNSKTTVVGEIVNDIWKMGTALTADVDNKSGVFFTDSAGTNQELITGKASVNCTSPSGTNVFASKPNLPNCSARTDWDSTDKLKFQENLANHKPRLDLPLYKLDVNLVELIKRGKNVNDVAKSGTNTVANVTADEDPTLSYERFANKQGIRISLADSQKKLPGCANAVPNATFNECGVQLDRLQIGYKPKAMTDGYQATALNTTRFAQTGKQMWIKVETVDFDYNKGVPTTKDITEDILSLGVTEPAPISSTFQIADYNSTTDSRSIVKLQRFAIPGPAIPNPTGNSYLFASNNLNIALRYIGVTGTTSGCSLGTGTELNKVAEPLPSPLYTSTTPTTSTAVEMNHLKCVRDPNTGNYTLAIAPFPIEVFDTREGVPNDRSSYTDTIPADSVTRAGVMSMIDIDVANLRKFLNGGSGSFDDLFPKTTPFALGNSGVGLKSSNIPQNKGWVLFVSDRRGDADFDGEYDMEDTIPDNTMEFNEDLNGTDVFNPGNGIFDVLYYSSNSSFFEAPQYGDTVYKSQAAASDHGYFRRGVRLINGSVLPGSYDRLNPTTTKGFTLASENGVYVKGNYNATSVTLSGSTAPASPDNYFPQGGTATVSGSTNAMNHIPAAVVSDAATILSNAWNDSESFASPFKQEDRKAKETVIRFALLTGDTITGKDSTVDAKLIPSSVGGLGNGGVHNFKRYLEQWTDVRLNYTGSLVNLFNSRNNNATFKCCSAVYNPPIRDWSFDTTFLDPNRLPPGTPFIYSMTFTGFQRIDY